MIVAVAMKTQDGQVYIARNGHIEFYVLYPDKCDNATMGFITNDLKFVDRKEALIIAKRCKQIKFKAIDNDELYSEDIFIDIRKDCKNKEIKF